MRIAVVADIHGNVRALRALIVERRVESRGFARATRYRLRAPTG